MHINWTKVVAAIMSGIIIALQGVNIGAINNAEHQVISTEGALLQKIYDLELRLDGRNEENKNIMAEIKKMLEAWQKAQPTPTPH